MELKYIFFDANTIEPQAWKNGGGQTQEIISFPIGANWSDFIWRVSIATIQQSGPFSIFNGIDRIICLLKGDGVILHSQHQPSHFLNQTMVPYSFKGEQAIDSEILGPSCDDLNLMTRRGQATGSMQIFKHSSELQLEANCFYLCLVQTGQWRFSCQNFNAGQTFLECSSRQGFWTPIQQQASHLSFSCSSQENFTTSHLIVMKIQLESAQ